MPPPDDRDLTLLLAATARGDPDARSQLVDRTYDELKRLAELQLRGDGHSLQPTALVHEAWLKLFGGETVQSEHRGQFFALAAKVMRELLIDRLRRRRALRRGGDRLQVTLDPATAPAREPTIDLLDLCEKLEELRALDPEQHLIVELRYFAGLTLPEIATEVGRSLPTVERHWRAARAWLAARLG